MNSGDRQLISFDWAMKKLLRSKANFAILEGFLSELLFEDITILEVLESESNQENHDDKHNRVDIKVRNTKGELIIIEVQFNDSFDFFHRILYGASKTICEHIEAGDKYDKVVKVISVNILYFDLGQGSDYIYKGVTEFKGIHANDILMLSQDQQTSFNKQFPKDIFPEYYIIKVNNFNNIAISPLDEWIYLLKNNAVKPEFVAKGIKEAEEALNVMKMNKEERVAYDRYLDENRLADSLLKTAENKGIAIGEQRGIAIGEQRGIAIGEQRGIEIGEQRGIEIGEQRGISIGEQRERNKNIISTIEILDDMGTPKSEIIEKIKVKFNISEEEIVKLL